MGTQVIPTVPEEYYRRQQANAYVSKRWDHLNTVANKGEERITNWIFILNTGGLASALAFIGTKGLTGNLFWSAVLFGAGVVLITLWGAIAYFRYEYLSAKFKKDVAEFDQGKISFEKLDEDDRKRSGKSKLMMLLGLLTSLAFCGGLAFGFLALESGLNESSDTPSIEHQAPAKAP